MLKQALSLAAIVTVAVLTQGQSLWIQAAATFATSMVVAKVFGQKAPKTQDNGVRQQVPPATINSLPIVYGDAFLGGTYIDAALSQDQKVMYHVLAISSISPNGQFSYDTTKFYYGDRLITFDSTDQTKVNSLTDGNGNVDTKIKNKLYINLYISSQGGTITSLNGAPAPSVVMGYDEEDKKTVPESLEWSETNRQMNGVAFAIVKLVYSTDAGTTSMSPITFHCSHYLKGSGFAGPGDVWYDYMINTTYGGAISPDLVDFVSAAYLNFYSSELITFTDNEGQPKTQPRYRINGVLDTGTNVLDNIDKMLECCDSWMSYNAENGRWSIVINKAQPASLFFNDDNIIGDITTSTIDINQAVNQIEAKFQNKLNKDVPDYVYLETPSSLLYPNEPINKYTTEFVLVNDSVQAQYLANRIIEQAREDLIIGINTTYYGIQANAGDVVSVTNSSYGWSSKLFRVMKVTESLLPNGSLGASLTLNEYNEQVYDDKDITEFTPVGNSDLPNIMYFGTLLAPTVTDQNPNAAVPTFSVDVTIPSIGQTTLVSLYYTTVSNPTDIDWILWGMQTTPSATPYTPNSTLKFVHIGLPTNTYYFGFKVANQIGESEISEISTGYTWLPNPSTSAVAGTFIATFSPPNLSIPYDGTPTFTGVTPQLYGTTAGGSVDFVPAQTDSDPLFVNDSWRIGGSETGGYDDIVKSGITIGNPTDGGFYALWSAPTAMATNPAVIDVPVRYKATDGTVYQGATAVLQFVYAIQGAQGNAGASGTQASTSYLYQWSTSFFGPPPPSGTSTFTWATGTSSNYTGGNGWSTTVPSNNGTAGLKLWVAAKGVTDVATALTTTVSWSGVDYSIYNASQNGLNGASGIQVANAVVYQWAATIPASPTGTSTYTWSLGTFSPTPSGWTKTPGTSPSLGFTLWEASLQIQASAGQSTSIVSWTSSTISAVGYAGTNGVNGATGASGASARFMYARIAGAPTPVSGTVIVPGDSRPTDNFQTASVWGFSFGVIYYANDPDPSSNNTLWQSDGIYNPTTNETAWSTPYISNLKVGSLSAITVNTGGLNVTDFIKAGASPAVSGSSMSGSGFTLNSGGTFAIGNSSKNMSFNGSTLTMNGDIVVTGNVVNNAITESYYDNSSPAELNGGNTVKICTLPNIPNPAPFQAAFLIWGSFYFINNRTAKSRYIIQMRKLENGGPYRVWYHDVPAGYDNLVSFSYFDQSPVFPNSYTMVVTAVDAPSTASQLVYAGSLICTVLKK